MRDETLQRIAGFLAIPFLLQRGSLEEHWPTWRNDLGETLAAKGERLFKRGVSEIAGLFTRVSASRIDSATADLSPDRWIPARPEGSISALLDGSPVQELLERGPRGRCMFVIGDNGAGKSLLLKQLAGTCLKSDRPVRAIAFATTDRFLSGADAPAGSNYKYMGAKTSAGGTSPKKLGEQLARLVLRIYAEPGRLDAFNDIARTLNFGGTHYFVPGTARSDFLESIHNLHEVGQDFDVRGWKLGMKRGSSDIVPFDHLSTGEQQLLLLIARLVAEAEPDTVFFIDEPETSLHVAWQRALPMIFARIASGFSADIVVATHSPVVISSATGVDDHCFAAKGGALEPIGPQTAASVERVLFEGFGTYTENNREVHERCAELVATAVSSVNGGAPVELDNIIDEFESMRRIVGASLQSLGVARTRRHLDLIEKAATAVRQLATDAAAAGGGDE
jgi:energy-coupling factor transporter ATP-binding protein EcfA2